MTYKERAYIAFDVALNKATQFDLETAYNAIKTNSEKISDGTVSGSVSFYAIHFYFDGTVKVKPDAIERPYNDWMEFRKINNASSSFDSHEISRCKNVLFRNDTNATINLHIIASLNKSNLAVK
jgi:hypothetical protein